MSLSRLGFLLSAPRSGSTLLIRILDSHSKIAAPCELGLPHVIPAHDQKYQEVLGKLQKICGHYGIEYGRALEDAEYLFSGVRAREGKELLVVKDPRHSLFVPRIDRVYTPRFVWLVRDARGVANSVLFKQNPETGFRYWWQYHSEIERSLQQVPRSRKHLLTYEALLKDPSATLETLVGFLGYQFEPGMLEFRNFEHADDRMLLWRGEAPADSFLQRGLADGIDGRRADPARFSDPVCQIYARLAQVRALNERMGYH